MNIGCIERIARNYLFCISRIGRHDFFDMKDRKSNNSGFSLLMDSDNNNYVVREEAFLEGCTRVFLINPILNHLLDSQRIQFEWYLDQPEGFSNYTCTNRTYELSAYIELIAVLNGKRIGIKYTAASYKSEETNVMYQQSDYLFNGKPIPGFPKLSKIDSLFCVDWTGISDEEIEKLNHQYGKTNVRYFTPKQFFGLFLTDEEYDSVLGIMKESVRKAKDVIALEAIPQLLPNNMYRFKQYILKEFLPENIEKRMYQFNGVTFDNTLPNDDLQNIKKAFYDNNLIKAVIGSAGFAKCYITAEYLFHEIKKGISIDYTSVIAGYVKAIEQITRIYYDSAFGQEKKISYWDSLRKNSEPYFDLTQSNEYRIDPYNKDKKQEKYAHYKTTKKGVYPDIGQLIWFLRYYERIWGVSELGKEYIYKCLDDYRQYCRNSYFHKDNLGTDQYETVERIRNNTIICLFYIIGGFALLDTSYTKEEQLGIVDYRFDDMYYEIRRKGRIFFLSSFEDGIKRVIIYKNDDKQISYDESGRLENAQISFIRTNYTNTDVYFEDLDRIRKDDKYIAENTIYITRDTMPTILNAFTPH